MCPNCLGPSPWGLCVLCRFKQQEVANKTGKSEYMNDTYVVRYRELDDALYKAKIDAKPKFDWLK